MIINGDWRVHVKFEIVAVDPQCRDCNVSYFTNMLSSSPSGRGAASSNKAYRKAARYGHLQLSDIIGGDTALEIAMDMLAAAGIISCLETSNGSNSTDSMWGADVCQVTMPGSGPELTCRHTVKQYAGMYAALEQACGRATAVEASFDRMQDIAMSWPGQALAEKGGLTWSPGDLIEPAHGGPKVHGNALQILALIAMQSGCPLPPSLRTAILASIDQDRAAR